MRPKSAFRPIVEPAEARVLATASGSNIEVRSANDVWVEIVNRTNRVVTFKLSDAARSDPQTHQLEAHTAGYFQVEDASDTVLIKLRGAPIAALDASPTRKGAHAYSIRNRTITTGPDFAGRGLGGVVGAQNVARFSILNQTSNPSAPGGVAVTIQFSVDGGRTFPLQDVVPYTGGLVPRPETIYYGNQGILYRLPANPSIRPTPLTSLRQYTLFSNTSFQPYLFPSS